MSQVRDRVTVRVPGSTSNCGAGFDTLGLALNLHNEVRLARTVETGAVAERPEDARAQRMVEEAACAYFQKSGLPWFGFSYRISGDVPPARGLGSSVTVRAGIVAGLAALAGSPLEPRALVGVVTQLEGHPDNAAAGVLGGFCVARAHPENGTYLDTVRFEIPPELTFVVASPHIEILTKESRGALPAMLPYFDAVRSINSATYLVAALAARDYEKLRGPMGDYMHEPYRLPGIPGGRSAIEAGVAAGALTGWLSGSGSSVLCVCFESQSPKVQGAMTEAFARAGLKSEVRVLRAENSGLRFL